MLSADAKSVLWALPIQLSLLLFDVSVNVSILRQIARRNTSFTTGFYTLYVCQGAVDVVDLVVGLESAAACNQRIMTFRW